MMTASLHDLECQRIDREVMQQHFFAERDRLAAENHRIAIGLDSTFQAVVESATKVVNSHPDCPAAREYLSIACDNYLRFLQLMEDFDHSNYELSELEWECPEPCCL